MLLVLSLDVSQNYISSYVWSTSSVDVFSMCIFFLFPSIESDSGSYNVLRG